MKSRKKLLGESRLYVIADTQRLSQGRAFLRLRDIRDAGADIIQLRNKVSSKEKVLESALRLKKLLKGSGVLFIVNDYLDIARIVDADGVHVGQDDLSIALSRRVLGKEKIIGRSCHSIKQALKAQKEGADYIGMGPLFTTATKPEYRPIGLKALKYLQRVMRIPVFAIGDVRLGNIDEIKSAGASRVAVCRAVLEAKDPASVIRSFKERLN